MLRIGHSGAAHSVGAILDVRAVGPIVRFDTGFAKTDKRRELWLTAAQQRQRRSGPIHDDPRIISNLSVWWHDRRLRLVLLVDQRAMHVSAGETTAVDTIPGTVAVDAIALLFREHLDVLTSAELTHNRRVRARRRTNVGGLGDAPPTIGCVVSRRERPLLSRRVGRALDGMQAKITI